MVFVPNIALIQELPISDAIDPQLVGKAAEWRNFNYLRGGLYCAAKLAMLYTYRIGPAATKFQ